jgi:hypothetical protein
METNPWPWTEAEWEERALDIAAADFEWAAVADEWKEWENDHD